MNEIWKWNDKWDESVLTSINVKSVCEVYIKMYKNILTHLKAAKKIEKKIFEIPGETKDGIRLDWSIIQPQPQSEVLQVHATMSTSVLIAKACKRQKYQKTKNIYAKRGKW